jgi:hypothetical protein
MSSSSAATTPSSSASSPGETARIERVIQAKLLMSKREAAREAKNFLLADEFRQRLNDEVGVEVFDQKDGPSGWKFKDGSSKKLPVNAQLPKEALSKHPPTETKQKKRNIEGDDKSAATSFGADAPAQSAKKAKLQTQSNTEANSRSTTPTSKQASTNSLSSSTIAAKVSSLAAKEKEQQRAALQAVIGTAANVKKVEGVIIEVFS